MKWIILRKQLNFILWEIEKKNKKPKKEEPRIQKYRKLGVASLCKDGARLTCWKKRTQHEKANGDKWLSPMSITIRGMPRKPDKSKAWTDTDITKIIPLNAVLTGSASISILKSRQMKMKYKKKLRR